MPKHHPYSRLEFRRRLRSWLSRNRRLFALLTGGLVGLFTFITLLLLATMPASPFRWWLLGTLQTAVVAAYLHMLYAAFLAHDGEAIWHLRGAWGEDNTRDELRRAKRKRLVWGWVDAVGLRHGDIDHLVVTREGGLVAIDSKWRYIASDTAEMSRAAQKVKLRAEALTRDLLKGDARGNRRARINPLSVTSVVVLWGAAQHGVPEGARVDGIEFIPGRKLVPWLASRTGESVDKAAATDILSQWESRRTLAERALAERRR